MPNHVNDPGHARTCSLCGARAARAAVQTFLRSLTESASRTDGDARTRALEELERLRARIKELEAELGTDHDDVTDHRTEDEIVIDSWAARGKRESRPRGDNSHKAIAIFKENAGR